MVRIQRRESYAALILTFLLGIFLYLLYLFTNVERFIIGWFVWMSGRNLWFLSFGIILIMVLVLIWWHRRHQLR